MPYKYLVAPLGSTESTQVPPAVEQLGTVGHDGVAEARFGDGTNRVTDVDLALAKDVGTQAASVNERAQDRAPGIPLHDAAGLAKAHAPAAHRADRELVADQAVEVHAPGHDVAAMLVWLPLYLLIMQKRVYKQGWIMTLVKYAVIGTCYSVLIGFGMMIALFAGLAFT